jgi:hypothetical protein
MHMAETNVDIDALIADFAQRSLQVGAERRKAVAEVVAFFDVADVNSIERFILGYCDGAEEPELSLFCELLGGHIVSRNRVEPLKALLRAARTNWFVRRSLVYGFPFHTSLTGRDSAALGELEKLASSDTTLGPERLAQAWIRGNDPDGVFRNDYIVGQIVGDVDDLIRSTDLDGIERFPRRGVPRPRRRAPCALRSRRSRRHRQSFPPGQPGAAEGTPRRRTRKRPGSKSDWVRLVLAEHHRP